MTDKSTLLLSCFHFHWLFFPRPVNLPRTDPRASHILGIRSRPNCARCKPPSSGKRDREGCLNTIDINICILYIYISSKKNCSHGSNTVSKGVWSKLLPSFWVSKSSWLKSSSRIIVPAKKGLSSFHWPWKYSDLDFIQPLYFAHIKCFRKILQHLWG